MGRSFLSIHQAINIISERWARSSRTLVREDKAYGRETADLAKRYASEAFMGCNIPLEGAVFSAMVELGKRERAERISTKDDDPQNTLRSMES